MSNDSAFKRNIQDQTKARELLETAHLPDLRRGAVEGLSPEAINFINTICEVISAGQSIFQTPVPTPEDWAMLLVVLANDSIGRATVTKNIVEVTGRAFGTVRTALLRFERLGYIESQQRIGRSELYVPTDHLKSTINDLAQRFYSATNGG